MSQCVVARGSAFALGDFQTFRSTAQVFVDSARRLSPELVAMPPFERLQAAVDHGAPATTEEQHGLVCAFLDGLKEASHRMTSPENYSFVAKCTEYDSYIDKVAREFRANARRLWPKQVKSENNAAIALAIDEIVAHVRGFAASEQPVRQFYRLYANAAQHAVPAWSRGNEAGNEYFPDPSLLREVACPSRATRPNSAAFVVCCRSSSPG